MAALIAAVTGALLQPAPRGGVHWEGIVRVPGHRESQVFKKGERYYTTDGSTLPHWTHKHLEGRPDEPLGPGTWWGRPEEGSLADVAGNPSLLYYTEPAATCLVVALLDRPRFSQGMYESRYITLMMKIIAKLRPWQYKHRVCKCNLVAVDVFPDVDEFRPSPNSNAWKSTHITMPDPIWTAEEIMAYVDGLGSPDVYWASFGYYPTTYEPMLRAAFDELVDAREAAEP